jgi:MarR family transcriptional regulator, lower aerobic nicotinate degradation pathway regulator
MTEDTLHDDQLKRLNYLIRRMHQTADAFYADETEPLDITPVQLAALRAIQFRPGTDQLRLANAIKLDRTTIAGVVLRLEKKQLITRAPAPHDRRSNLLYLTEAGRNLLGVLLPAADRAQRRMLAKLSPEERRILLDLIVRVVDQDVPTAQKRKKSA